MHRNNFATVTRYSSFIFIPFFLSFNCVTFRGNFKHSRRFLFNTLHKKYRRKLQFQSFLRKLFEATVLRIVIIYLINWLRATGIPWKPINPTWWKVHFGYVQHFRNFIHLAVPRVSYQNNFNFRARSIANDSTSRIKQRTSMHDVDD